MNERLIKSKDFMESSLTRREIKQKFIQKLKALEG